jgi:hypothetical protein
VDGINGSEPTLLFFPSVELQLASLSLAMNCSLSRNDLWNFPALF